MKRAAAMRPVFRFRKPPDKPLSGATLLPDMNFIWDHAKATTNLRKHEVAFEEACTVLIDPRRQRHP